MRTKMVVGNWKMHGSQMMVADLLTELAETVLPSSVGVMVCPPAVYLSQAAACLAGSAIQLGAQDISEHHQGAYTGQYSAEMLKDVGCQAVIIGHSERRQYNHETHAQIAAKFIAAVQAGLLPILCLGESRLQREQQQTEAVLAEQLDAVIQAVGIAAFAQAVIAYEPVWAIGTGLAATVQQAGAAHQFIRQHLTEYDGAVAEQVRVLYGGSVKPDNAAELFSHVDIDGALVGGASLQAQSFALICQTGE